MSEVTFCVSKDTQGLREKLLVINARTGFRKSQGNTEAGETGGRAVSCLELAEGPGARI